MDLEERLKETFRPMRTHVLGVLLWGSRVEGGATDRSDVDVCLVAGPARAPAEVLARAWRAVDPAGLDLDLRVFEELPMFLQGAVLAHNRVLMTEDEPALFEYLYPFRKRWLDQAHRQELTAKEAVDLAGGM